MSCSYCGAKVSRLDAFCPNCGTRLSGGTQSLAGVPLSSRVKQPKDSGLAFLIELIPGLFGFLGIGHMYAGQVTRGVLLLIGYWAFISFEILAMLGLVGWCLTPLNVLIPIGSAFWLKREMDREAGINVL